MSSASPRIFLHTGLRGTLVLAVSVAIGCESATAPAREDPPLAIASLTPVTLVAGASPTLLTVTGSGFAGHAIIRIDGADRPTTWHSPTSLTTSLSTSDLAVPRSLEVTVHHVTPDAGTSNALRLEVIAPGLFVRELQPSGATAGAEDMMVTVLGTGFSSDAVVRWDGSERPTVRVSDRRLDVTIARADLALAGRHTVSVYQSGSQGNNGLDFLVANSVPGITGVSHRYVAAGGVDFTLTVDGLRFTPGAVVRWKGSARPTTFVSPNRLSARIAAADITAAGPVDVQVLHSQPVGEPSLSNPYWLQVYPAGPHVRSLQAGDLVWDHVRDRLYASVRSTDAEYANHIVAIDPSTGEVVDSVFAGSDPLQLAIADDASVLYVALNGAAAIRPIDLSTFTAGLQFPVGISGLITGSFFLYAVDIDVMPGRPSTIAVTLQTQGYLPGAGRSLAVFDNGVPRPTWAVRFGTAIEFAGRDTLFVYDDGRNGHSLHRVIVTDTGVAADSSIGGLMGGIFPDFAFSEGRIFSTSGSVLDATRLASVGSVPLAGAVAADTLNDRVFYMWQNSLSVVSSTTLQLLGTENVPGVPPLDQPAPVGPVLVRWGTDGFAYRTFDHVVVFRSRLAMP